MKRCCNDLWVAEAMIFFSLRGKRFNPISMGTPTQFDSVAAIRGFSRNCLAFNMSSRASGDNSSADIDGEVDPGFFGRSYDFAPSVSDPKIQSSIIGTGTLEFCRSHRDE